MGIFSSKYKFDLNNSSWWIKLNVSSTGLRYRIKIDGETVLDQRPEQSSVETLTPQTLHISDGDQAYKVEIGPVSTFGYGIHIYSNNQLIYRHKDRDFVKLTRHEKVFSKLDRHLGCLDEWSAKDTRPCWKIIVEAMIIGAVIGTAYAILMNTLEAVTGRSFDQLGSWPAVFIAIILIFSLPPKLRIIR